MEPLASAIDGFMGFCNRLFPNHKNPARRNPIEILKRLHREAFTELMKLRDRQDKVEKLISLYRSSKGSPFEESSTIVRGEVDVLGALLMMDSADQQGCDAVSKAGIRTGIHSKFTFQRAVRQKDILMAELVASQNGKGDVGDGTGRALSLAKVFYMANVTDWLSTIAVPVGAQCRDVSIATSSLHQEKGLTDFSSSGPPFLNRHIGSGIGLTVRKLNGIASLAQFVSGLGMHQSSGITEQCFSTFGQFVCQLTKGTKLSLFGCHQLFKSSSQHVSLGALTIPIGFSKRRRAPETFVDGSAPLLETDAHQNSSAGSIALMVESELDESTRLRGWMEMNRSNPRNLQWAVSMSDDSDDGFGWGMSVSGMKEGSIQWDHFQVEFFIKVRLSNGFTLQPGVAYVMDGTARIPAVMLRSTWNI